MSPTEMILKDALALSTAERAQLVGSLMSTLPEGGAAVPVVTRTRPISMPVPMPPASDETCITWEGVQGFLED